MLPVSLQVVCLDEREGKFQVNGRGRMMRS
jgi:hypothetical protein